MSKILTNSCTKDTRERLLNWLVDKGVTMIDSVRYRAITDKGLSIVKSGENMFIEADNIALALPLLPNTDLFSNLRNRIPELYQIGDCREPRLTAEAIADGAYVGHRI